MARDSRQIKLMRSETGLTGGVKTGQDKRYKMEGENTRKANSPANYHVSKLQVTCQQPRDLQQMWSIYTGCRVEVERHTRSDGDEVTPRDERID
ncbi:hypothetical protein RUM43_005903 [Polyplax serrata]|uniref:Uncharacterized protein n=1 Tax=Polyplax serrata TaxID=468196 RepID=A0AAN8PE54_POLSC